MNIENKKIILSWLCYSFGFLVVFCINYYADRSWDQIWFNMGVYALISVVIVIGNAIYYKYKRSSVGGNMGHYDKAKEIDSVMDSCNFVKHTKTDREFLNTIMTASLPEEDQCKKNKIMYKYTPSEFDSLYSKEFIDTPIFIGISYPDFETIRFTAYCYSINIIFYNNSCSFKYTTLNESIFKEGVRSVIDIIIKTITHKFDLERKQNETNK